MIRLRLLPALALVLLLAHCASPRPAATPEPAPEPAPTETVSAPPAPVEEAPPSAPEAEALPSDWFRQAPAPDGFPGVAVERAYEIITGDAEPERTVVVAIIDSGVDIEHEDLDDVLWTNEDEIPGNDVDDDNNGYVDDIHGWNFIGGPDGRNVTVDTYELTREVAAYRDRFAGVDASAVPADAQEAYAYYEELTAEMEARRDQSAAELEGVESILEVLGPATQVLQRHLQIEGPIEPHHLDRITESDPQMVQQAAGIYMFLFVNDVSRDDLEEYAEHLRKDLEYRLDVDFDPRGIVGDDYDDLDERGYGNPDVAGPDPKHGTHVAGIIAAERDNDLGTEGIAAPVRIMVLRAVPDGDERDKDIANAIRYAADNGAHIINMSFGKGYSPQKEAVDTAVQYAQERGLLLVHAAGNDGEDLEANPSFPTRTYRAGGVAENWLEVGATTWEQGEGFVASFSNYGDGEVDLFAPGVDIYSTLPAQAYGNEQGTSMAAPVVTGVAALLMAHFPELTATDVRRILLDSVEPYAEVLVVRPGSTDEAVPFGQLSRTGGVVNAYRAVQQALQATGD